MIAHHANRREHVVSPPAIRCIVQTTEVGIAPGCSRVAGYSQRLLSESADMTGRDHSKWKTTNVTEQECKQKNRFR
eukprot:scaffold4244_cov167-Amphora_coffeaeformis.AAC.12